MDIAQFKGNVALVKTDVFRTPMIGRAFGEPMLDLRGEKKRARQP
jgi:hypothetical protein